MTVQIVTRREIGYEDTTSKILKIFTAKNPKDSLKAAQQYISVQQEIDEELRTLSDKHYEAYDAWKLANPSSYFGPDTRDNHEQWLKASIAFGKQKAEELAATAKHTKAESLFDARNGWTLLSDIVCTRYDIMLMEVEEV